MDVRQIDSIAYKLKSLNFGKVYPSIFADHVSFYAMKGNMYICTTFYHGSNIVKIGIYRKKWESISNAHYNSVGSATTNDREYLSKIKKILKRARI